MKTTRQPVFGGLIGDLDNPSHVKQTWSIAGYHEQLSEWQRGQLALQSQKEDSKRFLSIFGKLDPQAKENQWPWLPRCLHGADCPQCLKQNADRIEEARIEQALAHDRKLAYQARCAEYMTRFRSIRRAHAGQ